MIEILKARPRYAEEVDPCHVDGARVQGRALMLLRAMPEVVSAELCRGPGNVTARLRDGRMVRIRACASRGSVTSGTRRGDKGWYKRHGILVVAVDNSDEEVQRYMRKLLDLEEQACSRNGSDLG